MSIAHEALRDAATCAGLMLALPVGYFVAQIAKTWWKEVVNRWLGKNC